VIDNNKYPTTNRWGVKGHLQQTLAECGYTFRWRYVWAVLQEDGSWASSASWSVRRSAKSILREMAKDGWSVPAEFLRP
jgi:hypothetical protein